MEEFIEEPIWVRGPVPPGFWKNPENRRQYMEWLGKKLGYKNPEDWYKVTVKDFQSNQGGGLLTTFYKGSPSAIVMKYLPEYDWKEWLFGNVSLNFWVKPENRRRYMEWLGETLGYKTSKDWYKITAKDFKRNKGHRFLSYYQDTLSAAVMDYLPEYEWKEWLFGRSPQNFWQNVENRRRYMYWLGEKLGYKTPEDWYKIAKKDFHRNSGYSILNYYHDSPSAAVMDYLPEYEWKEWCFVSGVPKGFWKSRNNRRRYMHWLGKRLGYEASEDWYQITAKDFRKNDGHSFLDCHKGSPSAAVMEYLPEYEWKEWCFVSGVPKGFWKSRDNRYQYMQWLGKRLGYELPEDWYKVTQKDFAANNGEGLLVNHYQSSPSMAVIDCFPNYAWKEWYFSSAPQNFWKSRDNRLRYMHWLGEQLGYTQPEDWYRVTKRDFASNKGHGLLNYYRGSPSVAVMKCFPYYEWKEWLFRTSPMNFWNNSANRRRYMQWLGEQLGFKEPKDWYKITQKDFVNNKGRQLLKYYQDSPSAIVMEYFLEYDWKEWLFVQVPLNFWNNLANRRRYMQWLGEQLGFRKHEDWYKLTQKDFHRNRGSGFMNYYHGSPSAAVVECFPDYEWKEWLFENVLLNFWKTPDNRRRYMAWLEERLGYKKSEDWYGVTLKEFYKNKGRTLLKYCQYSYSVAVMEYIPHYDWQPEKFSERKKRQKQLYRIVKRIFSAYDVKWDFKHPEMRFEHTGYRMELDIFIPSLHLAIEYQGEQHVLPISVWGGISALEECQKRDEEKRNACKKHGITLIEVPHSWDGREDTAIEMLSQQFVKKVKDRVKGTKQIQAALKAINTYCKKKQRKSRKKASINYQGNFSFFAQQQDG